MANKNNSSEACFNVYDIITHSSSKGPKEIIANSDAKTRCLALFYLLKSYEMGYESAKYQVVDLFGEGKIPPKSSDYLEQLAKKK